MKKFIRKSLAFLMVLVLFLGYFPNYTAQPQSATLSTGSLSLSDSRPSTTSVTYTHTFSNVTLSATKCIKVQFNTAADMSGTVPTGLTTTGGAFSATSNYIPTPASWTGVFTTNGTVTITFATGETPAGASGRTVVLTGITNGSTADTAYYAKLSTFNNIDCATSPLDNGTVALIFTSGQSVSATVDPSLSFTIALVGSGQTVNGATTTAASTTTTIPFGALSTGSNKILAHDLTVGTNANSGYTVTLKYTGVLTNGSYNITNWSGTNAAPTTFSAAGTESFGYTTEDAVLGTGTTNRFTTGKWAAFTTSPLEVAYNDSAVSQTIRTGYQVGISSTTSAGSYTTTVVYTATPTY